MYQITQYDNFTAKNHRSKITANFKLHFEHQNSRSANTIIFELAAKGVLKIVFLFVPTQNILQTYFYRNHLSVNFNSLNYEHTNQKTI